MTTRLRVQNSMSLSAYRQAQGLDPIDPPPARKPRSYPEQQLQIACVGVLTRLVPPPEHGGPWWSALNPVPGKSKAVAGLSKAMGMKAGVPDMLLIHDQTFLFIEFKAAKGRIDPKQRDAMAAIEANGGAVEVCRSVSEFIETIRRHGIPCRVAS